MSFAVIHMQKIKMGGLRGIQNHDQRLKESQTNPDIDYQKSCNNINLDRQPLNKTYYNRVRDRIKQLNLPKAVRKDAVVMCSFICTSDKKFFDELSPEQQERFFKESYNFLKDRYGAENIVHSTIHLDEKTPHMHMGIVPVTQDGRLSAKKIFNKTELHNLQSDYQRCMNEHGFDLERGSSSERKHLSVQEFKLETKLQEIENTRQDLHNIQLEANKATNRMIEEKEKAAEIEKMTSEGIKKLKQDTEALENEKNALEGRISNLKGTLNSFYDIDRIGKKGLTGKITMTPDEADQLKEQSKAYIAEKSRREDLEISVKNYQRDQKSSMKMYKEIIDLKKQLKQKDGIINVLKSSPELIKSYNERVREINQEMQQKQIEKRMSRSKGFDMER